MEYRISTADIAKTGIDGINRNQAIMADLINQISTGVRTDLDPVEQAQKDSYTVTISNNAQNIRNGETVLPNLTTQETALSSLSEKLIQLQNTIISAQNPATYNKNITQNSIDNLKTDILNIANSKDSQGNFVFSGYKSQTQAFSDIYTYNGDQGIKQIRIGNNSMVDTNITGNQLITKNITDTFTKMQNFINTNINDPSILDSVQNAISDTSVNQAIIGSNINKISDAKKISTDLNLNNQARLSQISDVDLASLISQLSQAKNASEASLKSYALIQNLSLFNYI